MGIDISYMGTKRKLATRVSECVSGLPEGPLFDVFSGMCAVGQAITPDRQIWTNDIQIFPALVSKALFCSKSDPISSKRAHALLQKSYKRNLRLLEYRFSVHLKKEKKYFETANLNDAIVGNTGLPYIGNDENLEQERQMLEKEAKSFPYRYATITFVGSYFGVKQCMELDSLRYAIDKALSDENISKEQWEWLIIGLGKVLTRINNSTGQFAQFIKPKARNIHRIIGQRRKSVWDHFLGSLETMSAIGTKTWRLQNRSYCADALELLKKMRAHKKLPAIIYADPPYSTAQYSRYYHVLDSMVEYQYRPVSGDGRYPDNRFQTPFAQSAKVFDSMKELVAWTSKLGACFLLSYPENGLYCKKGGSIQELLRKYYGYVDVKYTVKHEHSTFGNPSIPQKLSAIENMYLAYN